ncbi:MAG: ABC transporter substrate-binding protein [Halarsenatibacteraceae bacterium]
MKKSLITAVLLASLILVVFANGVLAQDGPIKIGAVNPLGDVTGAQSTNAMELAVEEINAEGGLLGREVELIVIDSELRPEKGASAIERLATSDEVDFFVGGMASGVHMAQVPVLKRYEKITIWAGAASHQVENAVGPDADWYFHLHPWDYQQGASYGYGWKDIAEQNSNVEIDKFFLAYEEGAFGTDSYQSYVEYFEDAQAGEGPYAGLMGDLEGVSFKSAATGGGDYRAMLRQAIDYDPDIFVWAGYDADAIPMLAQARELGFQPPLYVGAPPGWPADFGNSPLAENVVLYGMWAPSLNEVSPVAKHFWDGYIEMHGHEPATYFAPLGYTNIHFLAEGIKHAGTIEKEALIEALREIEYDTALGTTLSISPSRVISNQGFSEQKILQWQDGTQHVIWPFDVSTSEIVYPYEF